MKLYYRKALISVAAMMSASILILASAAVAAPNAKINHAEKAVQVDDINKIIMQARHDREKGDWQKAITLLSGALAKNPDNIKLKKEIGGIYLNQATSLLKKDSHSAPAVELAKQALYLDPSNNEAQKIIVATWGVLNPPGFAFSVRMPNLADHQSTNGLQGKTDNWIVNYGGGMYQVGANKFNGIVNTLVPTTAPGRLSILDGMVKGYFASIGAKSKSGSKVESLKLISEKPFCNCMAKHYTFSIRRKDGQILNGKSVFCINESFSYIFSVISKQNAYDLADSFISSVQIDSPAKK